MFETSFVVLIKVFIKKFEVQRVIRTFELTVRYMKLEKDVSLDCCSNVIINYLSQFMAQNAPNGELADGVCLLSIQSSVV